MGLWHPTNFSALVLQLEDPSNISPNLISMNKRLKKGFEWLAHNDNEDILYMIFNQCSLRDCFRMGAVCKSWLSVFKWSTKDRLRPLPWLMMLSNPNFKSAEKDLEEDQDQHRCFFNLSDNTMSDSIKFPEFRGKRCCGSFNNGNARGWLMIIDNENLEMRLFHPWHRIQLQLPHHSTLPRQYAPINSQDFPLIVDMKIQKAAMSDDAAVVAVVHDGSALAFCRIDDKVWTSVRSEFNGYSDVIYHKGQFYAITTDGSIGILHISTPNPYVQILTGLDTIGVKSFVRTYLVADSASMSLFIIVRDALRPDEIEDQYDPPYEVPNEDYNLLCTLGFKVYELGLEETGEYKKNPVQVESLGDRVIFLGQNSSMLVMASQFPGLKGNCIYFTDDYMEAYLFESPIGCVDLGIFNMEDKTIQPLFRDRFHPNFSPPVWIAPPGSEKG